MKIPIDFMTCFQNFYGYIQADKIFSPEIS